MKILHLSLRNLNALYGTWHIDFTHPAYQSSGLFAITGATGAGKSTLLDAICLALYGRTPRLDKISKTSNDIMSRGTSECAAELTFAVGGKTYLASWSQRRARGRGDGALQLAKHEIATVDGQLLEDKSSLTPKKIATLIGLDFARFTRTILLAQGQFAAFLHANAAERAEILEKITGTAIYSDLSIATHERQRAEQARLTTLQQTLGGFTPPSDDERAASAAALAAAEEKARAAAENLAACQQRQQQYHHWQQLCAEREQLQHRTREIAGARAAFAPQEARWRTAERVASHWTAYQQWQQQRHDAENATRAAAEATAAAAEAARTLKAARATLAGHQNALHTLRADVSAVMQQIALARDLDRALPTLRAICAEKARAEAAARANLPRPPVARDGAPNLAALLAGQSPRDWQQAFFHAERRAQNWQRIAHLQSEMNALTAQHDALSAKAQTLHNKLRHASDHLAAAEQWHDAQQTIWQQCQRIASLEEERARLRPAEPCPLCGATVHPYADHAAVPSVSMAEESYRAAEQALATQQATHGQLSLALLATENEQQHLARQQRALAAEIARLQADLPAESATAEACHAQWQAANAERAALSERLAAIDYALWAEANAEWQRATAAIEDNRAARRAVLTIDDLTGLETHWQQRLSAAQEACRAAERALTAQEVHQQQAEAASQRAKNAADTARALVQQANAVWAGRWAEWGFADENEFCVAHLPDDERQQLAARAGELTQAEHDNDLLTAQNATRLQAAEALLFSHDDPSPVVQAAQIACESAQQQLGAARSAWEALTARDTGAEEGRQAVRAQAQECRRWEALHALIGSADGKKYRNFVQGLTFAALLQHANAQLVRLSPRYVLACGEERLSLDVIDCFQNNERRTAKNLSGGEGFLVSLALALGLAQMNGHDVAIDSLFLDEGFGTLDEEALDSALDVLASLQEDGKLIGIISHVAALKERLATQIVVCAGAAGRSTLHGAGVSAGR